MKAITGLMMVVAAGTLLACLGLVTPAAAYPPDPDNAGVLYYQAFLLMAQMDDRAATDLVANVANGTAAPNDKVREYVKECRTAIRYALMATEREQCNWGIVYSKGFSAVLPHLAQCRSLARLVLADARLLASEGNCREALERCLRTKRLARHVGDDIVIALLVQHAIEAVADDCIRDILGLAPADPQTLDWLNGQLVAASVPQASFVRGLKYEQEMALELMQMDRVAELREVFRSSDGQPAAPRLPAEIDEEFLAKNREYYARYMTTMQATLARPMPYAEKWSALRTMQDQMMQEAGQRVEDVVTSAIAPALGKVYSIEVKAQARANALRVGLELLNAKAQTGKLPDRLPVNTLKDPFSGEDYLYQKTAAGFVLRCRGKDLDKGEVYEWEFKVK